MAELGGATNGTTGSTRHNSGPVLATVAMIVTFVAGFSMIGAGLVVGIIFAATVLRRQRWAQIAVIAIGLVMLALWALVLAGVIAWFHHDPTVVVTP